MHKTKFSILQHPLVVLLAIFLGAIIGIYFQNFVPYIKPFGKVYLALLEMCVIPIMVSAIVTSIGRLVLAKNARKLLSQIFLLSLLFLVISSSIGLIVGLTLKPGSNISVGAKKYIGEMIINYQKKHSNEEFEYNYLVTEISSKEKYYKSKPQDKITKFILNLIPKNIFKSLSKGENLKIIFFFIIFALMLKFVKPKDNENVLSLFDSVFKVFEEIIDYSLYFLPFGLFSLTAYHIADIGKPIFKSFFFFILLIIILSLIIVFISSLIVYKYSKKPYFKQFKALKEAIFIALATREGFATLPYAIKGLHQDLELNEDKVKLVVPIGITLCRYGNVLLFSLMAIFTAQLYHKSLSFLDIGLILIGSIISAMATTGVPGLVAKVMIGTVLSLLKLPSEVVILIILALDPIIDPFLTLIDVYPTYALTSIIASNENNSEKEDKK